MLTQQAVPINIGISEEDRKSIVGGLERLLADSYMLYLKTLYFHWNVTGPMFQPLHDVFEAQYQEMLVAVDDMAERIRALGFPAPGTFTQFNRLTSITEDTSVPDTETMIKVLVQDHETVIRTARQVAGIVRQTEDEGSMDLIIKRMEVHEKTAWMLRSFLKLG
jgi:starvation-inducible DNA-binding protein